jgi:sugar phosphate isomerase/epimerase
MNRREFMNNTMAISAGLSLAPTLMQGCASKHDPLHDFGLISNVVQNLMQEDHRATMSMLADMGYSYLEFGGTYGEDPAELIQFMSNIGLVPLAGGTSIVGMQGKDLKTIMDDCLVMGKKYLVCYWPWMDGGDHPTWDQVNFAVDEFHRIGEECNKQGLRFAFHNHEKEFKVIDNQVIYAYMLENTDPELVTMEVDLYWAHKGGADIREYFKKYPGRFELVHAKDSYDSPDLRSFACVGSGIINFPDLFSYREVGGFKHIVVEHDQPGAGNEKACAQSSINYLKSLDF